MTEDENIIHIFMNTNEIGKNKCIPLSDEDYKKIKITGTYGLQKLGIILKHHLLIFQNCS